MYLALSFKAQLQKFVVVFIICRHLNVTEMLNDKPSFAFSSSKNSILQNFKAKNGMTKSYCNRKGSSLVDTIAQYFRKGIADWTIARKRDVALF